MCEIISLGQAAPAYSSRLQKTSMLRILLVFCSSLSLLGSRHLQYLLRRENVITPTTRDADFCDKQIIACLGAEVARYAQNKVRGGSNGRKGTRYEDFYGAYKVAEEAVSHLNGSTEWPTIEDQVYAFVDDLVLTWPRLAHYHQLKNVQALSWTAGEHPLVVDFQHQVVFSKERGETAVKTTLVVANEDVFNAMSAVPASIADHSNVVFFPYADGHANRLVIEYKPLRDLLTQLTRLEDASDDELGSVLGMLMLGMQQATTTTVEAVIEKAQRASPSLIRLFPWQMEGMELQLEFVNVLDKIFELQYGVSRGFFHWNALGTSGTLQFNCLSQDFERFQKRVIELAPETFEKFEELT